VKGGYCGVLLEELEIDDCAKNPGNFIVLDCPLGSGKTLAREAELLFDKANFFLNTHASEISTLQGAGHERKCVAAFLAIFVCRAQTEDFNLDTFLAKHGLKGKLLIIFLDETPVLQNTTSMKMFV
jgi:hypothetical protein